MFKPLLKFISLSFFAISPLISGARNPETRLMSAVIPTTRVAIDVYDCESVDVRPSFPGGDTEMLKFINKERRYPSQAYHRGIEGRVLCSFVVNKDGSISHVSVIKGVEESLNREAVRIVSNMPAWDAGQIDETPVPVYYILPISFRK